MEHICYVGRPNPELSLSRALLRGCSLKLSVKTPHALIASMEGVQSCHTSLFTYMVTRGAAFGHVAKPFKRIGKSTPCSPCGSTPKWRPAMHVDYNCMQTPGAVRYLHG
eukprot:394782-Amphidinium_carterae.1